MLSTKDMTLLRGMFCDILNDALEANNHALRREIRDEIHSVVNAAVFASEERANKRFDEVIQKIEHTERVLQNEIDGTNTILLGFIEEVEPKIAKHEKKIVRIQRHVNLGSNVNA